MARVGKIILSIASGSVLYSGLAPAVGLGEITINSALNQPLEAEIELLQVGDLSESEMRIALASPDAFMRAGVDRALFLDDLRFTTLLRGSKSIIRVVSKKPVREPYLNFVVEMTRPTGRLLREYTLLVDPPRALADRPQAAGFQRSSAAPAPRMQLPVVRATPLATQGNTYNVVSGDSLWKIARRLQSAGSQISLPLLMADIHALNPQAFVGGDIDRLIAGAVLLLPDRANPANSTAAAPVVPSVPAAPAPVGQIALPLADVASVQRQLDEAVTGQQNQMLQLQQQMQDLDDQLSRLQQQVAGKNEQIAALQAQLRKPTASLPAAAAPVVDEIAATPLTVVETPYNWLLGFIGGALLSAIAGGVIWRRRHAPQDNNERIFADYQKPSPATAVAPVRVRVRVAPALESMVAGVSVNHLDSASAPVAEPDGLEEASIYLAYDRLDEARKVLERMLEKEPSRNDIRTHLLELLGKMGDSQGFTEHAQLLLANAGDPAQLQRIKSSFPDLAATDALPRAVLNLEPRLPQASNESLDEASKSLTKLSLEEDWGLLLPLKPAVMAKSALLEEVPSSAGSKDLFGQDQHDLGHLASHPQSLSRLNMALAFIEQGDLQSACAILNQLISEGDERQKKDARALLARIA